MSRGIGRIQRECLKVVTESGTVLDSLTVAGRVFGVPTITGSQHNTTRRALNGLRDAGAIVSLGRQWRAGRRGWATKAVADAYIGRTRKAFGDDAIRSTPIETGETIRRPRG